MCFCLLQWPWISINAKALARNIHCGWMCLQLLLSVSKCCDLFWCFKTQCFTGCVCVTMDGNLNNGNPICWDMLLFLIICPVVELCVSHYRPCSDGLHHFSLVPPAHALWQHLIHRWICHPAGLKSLHSSRGPGGRLLDFSLWHREGRNFTKPVE